MIVNAMTEKVLFSLGCFWEPDDYFSKLNGVVRTRVGYAGGKTKNPTYKNLDTHTESIEIEFDPSIISYDDLLNHFWKQHDSTEKQQTQYKSVIFVHNKIQQSHAEASREREQKKYKKQILTEILPASAFYEAEQYHQKYLAKTRGEY